MTLATHLLRTKLWFTRIKNTESVLDVPSKALGREKQPAPLDHKKTHDESPPDGLIGSDGSRSAESPAVVRNTRLHVGAQRRWDGSLGFFLGSMMSTALVPQALSQSIVPDGRTATTVTPSASGTVNDVRTTTMAGGNAFNSFTHFNVLANTTANLHVPAGAANLVNIVRDQRTSVDGMLNAIQDGRVGGNVWFANPHGFIVGSSGVVNVGSLSVSTPTQRFVDDFFDPMGRPDANAVSDLLGGTAPRNPGGTITINGRINAIGGASFSAGSVIVGGSVYAGARFTGTAPDFSDVVNANGIASANNVITEGGRIRIVADGNIAVSGTLAAPGAAGVAGGTIDVSAGGNLDVQADAMVTARGNGTDSSGGSIAMFAGGDAVFRAGAVINASAGTSGDGGTIALEANETIELAGGAFFARGAGEGAIGSVSVNARQVNSSRNYYSGGADHTINGLAITIGTGVVVSTRNVEGGADADQETAASRGDSGNLALNAATITLEANSKLLSHATGTHDAGTITLTASEISIAKDATVFATAQDGAAGNIHLSAAKITAGAAELDARATGTGTSANVTLEAKSTPVVSVLGKRESEASVVLAGTRLRGQDVSISATTEIKNTWEDRGDTDDSALQLTTIADDALKVVASFAGLEVVHAQAIAKSTVTVGSGTQIEAAGTVSLVATNDTEAKVLVPNVPGVSPLGLGAMYMRNDADATVELKGGASVTAANLSLRAHNTAVLEGNLDGKADDKAPLAFAVGITQADVNARAVIEQAAVVTVTDRVDVTATNKNSFSNNSSSTANKGIASVVVAVSDHQSSTSAEIAADLSGARTVNVTSVNLVNKDETAASASVGRTFAEATVASAKRQAKGLTQERQDALYSAIFSKPPPEKAKLKENPFRLGGAIAWSDSQATATSTISGNVTARDQIVNAARVIQENSGSQAHAAAKTASSQKTTEDTAAVSVSAGVVVANYRVDADARVGVGAVLTSNRIGVSADVLLPAKSPASVSDWSSWSEVKDSVGAIVSYTDPFTWFNGGASAKASGTDYGLAGAVNIQTYRVNARAIVEDNAQLVLTGSNTGAWAPPAAQLGDVAADDQIFTFDAQAHVRAYSDTTLRFLVGKPTSTAGGESAVGGAVNIVEYSGETLALLREGAQVRGSAGTTEATEEFRLTAESDANIVAVALLAGAGESMGLTGTVTVTTIDRNTQAVIDNEAIVRAATADVHAQDDTTSWSIGGGLAYSGEASVGLGVAVNTATLRAVAAIADNDTLAGGASDVAATNGRVAVRDLQVRAETLGHLETIAVAGAVANKTDPDPESPFSQLKALYDQQIDDLAAYAKSKPTSISKPAEKEEDEGGTKYKFTLAGAGSVAVNETDIQATAKIEDAVVEQSADAAGLPVLQVQAVNQTDVVTAAAGGALTRAKQSGAGPSVGVAGAVAVNNLSGGAEAAIRNSTVTGADDVAVHAVKGGETLSIAIGLNVNASAESSKSWQGTGALSMTFFDTDSETDASGATKNKVSALVDNSTVTGAAGTATGRSLDVAAYNRTRLGTGGGALALGGDRGVGGAVSYADVRQNTEAGIVGNSVVTQFDAVGVNALNSMQIASGAAMVTASRKSDAIQISGSVVLNEITNRTVARIDGSTVGSSGAVTVNAQDVDAYAPLDALLSSPGDDGLDYNGGGLRAGIGGIDGVAQGNSIVAVAGNVTVGTGSGSTSVGLALTYNRIQNVLSASVDNAAVTADGTLQVSADSKTNILAIAAGVSVSDQFAGAGSVTINEIDNQVTARIDTGVGTTITARDVTVSAKDGSRLDTLAGAVSASMSGSAVGAAITYNNVDNAVTAQVVGAGTLAAQDGVLVQAINDSTARSAAVAAALSSSVSGAASLSLNFIDNATTAELKNSVVRLGSIGNDAFQVLATDSATIETLAGSIAGGSTAIGGAIAYSDIGNSARVNVEGADIDGAESFRLNASSDGSITSIAVAGAAGSTAVAGSASANTISNTTRATLVDSTVTGQDAVAGTPSTMAEVLANDDAQIQALAGGAAFAGSAAIGAAVAVNRIDNTTDAAVSGKRSGSQGHQVKSLRVVAESDESIKSAAAGVAVSGDLGIGGSVSINLIGNETTARIDSGAQVSAHDNVGVIADADDKIILIAGSVGIGAGAVGAGLSVAVNQIGGATRAFIDGASTRVDARAASSDQVLTVKSGLLTTPVFTPDQDALLQGGALAQFGSINLANLKADEAVQGVAVNASASHLIENVVINLAAGSVAGVGGVTNVNVVGGTTEAFVNAAQVNQDVNGALPAGAGQALTVTASDHTFTNGFVGSVSGGLAGIGAAVDVGILGRTTRAYLDDASVSARDAVAVQAYSTQGASSFAVGASGGAVAVAGTAAATTFRGETHAYAKDSQIHSGGLVLKADHDTSVFLAAGAVVVGGAAAGASVGVAIDEHATKAELLDSAVESAGAVEVNADSTTQINTVVVAGALSASLSFAGNASFTMVKNTTLARVAGGTVSATGTDGSVNVIANDRVEVGAKGGALGVGATGGGIAAGASVVRIENSTQAAIESGTVRSAGDILIKSTSDRDAAAQAIAVGGGLAFGISGSAAVVLSGSGPSAEASQEIDNGNNGTVSQASSITAGDRLASSGGPAPEDGATSLQLSAPETGAINTAGKTDLKARVTGASATATLATADGANLNAAGSVTIRATETNELDTFAGSAAGGGLAAGGGVAITDLKADVRARTRGNTVITAGNGIAVEATAAAGGSQEAVRAQAYQGSAGLVGLGAAVATATSSSTVEASVSQGSTLTVNGPGTAGASVRADDSTTVKARAVGASFGAVAAGVVVAQATKTGSTRAVFGLPDAATSAPAFANLNGRNLSVLAARSGAVKAEALAGAGGIASGAGAAALASDAGSVAARLGGAVNAGGDIVLDASYTAATSAEAIGYSAGLIGGMGVSVANASNDLTVDSAVESGSTVAARSLSVRAESQVDPAEGHTADAYAQTSAGGGLVGVGATDAAARHTANVTAQIGNDVTLSLSDTAAAASLAITASNDSNQRAVVSGVAVGGLLGLGSNTALASAGDSITDRTTTVARIGTGVSGDAGKSLVMSAEGHDENYAQAIAGSGGVIAGQAAYARTVNNSDVQTDYRAEGTEARQLTPNEAELRAKHTAVFNTETDSVNAGVVGASGAFGENDVNSIVTAQVADGARLEVGRDATTNNLSLSIQAENVVRKADNGWDVRAASGGLFAGAGAYADTDVVLNTTARVGNAAAVLLKGENEDSRYGVLSITATNSINAVQRAKLDAGGAVAVALAESDFHAVANARVVVGTGAEVDSRGEIVMGASTSANVLSESNTSTYGVAGVAEGQSRSTIDTDNEVTVQAGASVRADWDIRLQAGQAGTTVNNLSATALTNIFNNVVIPISGSPGADALIEQKNEVTVAGGVSVRSVRDVYLEATNGTTYVRGHGLAKDIYQEILAEALGAIGIDVSFETTGGSSTVRGGNGVRVDGDIAAGIQNIVDLKISGSGANPTITANNEDVRARVFESVLEDLLVNLDNEIAGYKAALVEYLSSPGHVARFQAELDRLNLERTAILGEGRTAKPVYVTRIDDITATGGDIHVKGSKLSGSGKLSAPGNASINIASTSDNYIRVGRLVIPDNAGGNLYLNGAPVSSNQDINDRTGGGAGFASIATGATAGAPTINVTIDLPSTSSAQPDLEINDEVRNLGGAVNLLNRQGSIIVKPVKRADGTLTPAGVAAQTVNIEAGRDFVLAFVDGFYSVASDPRALWAPTTDALIEQQRQASIDFRIANPNGVPPDYFTTSSLTRTGVGSTVAGNNVFLNARYLNINGLVQAGLPERSVHLDDNFRAGGISVGEQIRFANASYRNGDKSQTLYPLQGLTLLGSGLQLERIEAVWNARDERIELRPVGLQGSYMQLTGQIINTGGGELRTVDGYGKIEVRNDTKYAVVLNGLDTGNNLEGVIRITDTSKPVVINGVTQFTTTEYRRLGSDVVVKKFAGDNEISSTTTLNSRSADYETTKGVRYGWTTGQKQTVIDENRRTDPASSCRSSVGGSCAEDLNAGLTPYKGRYTQDGAIDLNPQAFLESGGLVSTTANFGYDFSYEARGVEELPSRYSNRYDCGLFCIQDFVVAKAYLGTDYHRFTVKADYDIKVSFGGYDTSDVKVDSVGSILLGQGTIASRAGGISLVSKAGSIQGLSDGTTGADTARSALVAQSHNLFGRDGVGTQASAITLNQVGSGSVTARATNATVAVRTTSGDLTVKQIDAGTGNAYVTAERNLIAVADGTDAVRVSGRNVALQAVNGAIGTNAVALNLQVGAVDQSSKASAGLSAKAATNINVRQAAGNLYLNAVESAAGDVTITAASGGIYDWNKSETADTRTIEELRAWWDSLGLTGAAAAAKIEDNIAQYQGEKRRQYEAYWQVRQVKPKLDAAGAIVAGAYEAANFDAATYRYIAGAPERASLVAIGWSDERIATYEAQRTSEILAAHAAYGSQAYTASFTHQVSDAERADLSKGGTWSESQLRYSMSLGALRATGDTTAQVEAANVVGRHVTLNAAAGSVGKSGGTVVLSQATAGNLTDEQKIAAAAAERDDIFIDNPNGIVRIEVKDDVDVDFRLGGSITINARNEVYLGSEGALDGESRDVNVRSIRSAQGDIRIKVAQGIRDVQTSTTDAAVSGRNLVVEGGAGGIGTEAAPLTLDLQDGATVTARATGDVHLKERTGDMNVVSVFSGGAASLTADGSILDALNDPTLKAKVGSLTLNAGRSIGTAGNAFEVDLASGPLTATTRNGGVFVDSLAGTPLAVANVSVAGGDLVLRGGVGGLAFAGAVNVTGSGAATLNTGAGIVDFMAGSSLATEGGAIRIDTPMLDMAEGTQLRSATGTIALATQGDMFLSRIETGNATGFAITASSSAGRILEASVDPDADIVANTPGAVVTLNAAGGIGNATRTDRGAAVDATTPNAIEMQVAALDASSSAGAIRLAELDGLQVGSVSANGTLDLQVGGALNAATLASTTGSVAVVAQSVAIDSVSAQGSVTLAATGGELTTGVVTATTGTAELSSAGTLTAGTTTAGGDLQLLAGGDLNVTTVASQDGAMSITSTTGSIAIADSANAQGTMTLQAATGLTAGVLTTDAGSISASSTGGDLTAGVVTATTGSVALSAAGTLTAGTTTSGGDLQLSAGGDLSVTTAVAQDGAVSMTSTTGSIAVADSASALGTMTLQAATGLTAGALTADTGSIAAVTSGGDLAVTTADSAGTLSLQAGEGAVRVGTLTGTGDVTVTAGQSVDGPAGTGYTSITSTTGDVAVQARGGSVVGQSTQAAGSVTVAASQGLDLSTTQASGGAVSLAAGTGDANVDQVQARGDITVSAGQSIGGTQGAQYTRIDSLVGQVTLTAAGGGINGGTTQAAGDVRLDAAGDIALAAVTSAAGDVTAVADGAIAFGEVTATTGSAKLQAQGDITGNVVAAPGGDVSLDSAAGRIAVGRIVSDSLLISAQGAINGQSYRVGRRLVLRADSVDATVTHTQASPALELTVEGRSSPVMRSVNLTLDSAAGMRFDRFQADNAQLRVTNGTLEIASGYIGTRMVLDNPLTHLLMDNTSPDVQQPYDVQLYSAPKTFSLFLDRNTFRTTGADIIRRNDLTHTVLSESTGLDSSVAEASTDAGVLASRLITVPSLPSITPLGELVRYEGTPVMMQGAGTASDNDQAAE